MSLSQDEISQKLKYLESNIESYLESISDECDCLELDESREQYLELTADIDVLRGVVKRRGTEEQCHELLNLCFAFRVATTVERSNFYGVH